MDGRKEKSREGQNLYCLIKLQFLQKRLLFLGLLLLEFFYVVYGIVSNLRECSALGDGIHVGDVGSLPETGYFIVLLFFCLGGYNAADNKHLSMYPGTRKTRYFSRIILDYLFLFCFAVWLAALYLAVYGVYQVVHQVWPDIDLLYFFSWGYMLRGCIGVFFFSAALYGITQFIYIVMCTLGRTGYLLACLAGLLFCALFVKQLYFVYQSFGQPFSWGETVGACFLAGVVLAAVNSTAVICRNSPLRAVPGSAVLLAATVFFFSVGLKIVAEYQDVWQYENSPEEPEKVQSRRKVLREFEITWDEWDRADFLHFFGIVFPEVGDEYKDQLYFETAVCPVSDLMQRDGEKFDSTKVTEGKFLLRIETDSTAENEVLLYNEILDNIEIKKEKNQLYYRCDNRYYALNFMFGEPNPSQNDIGNKIWEMAREGVTDELFLTAVIDDETWKLYKSNTP
ncbi:hypothetical protein D7V86_02210 [bacterium D16-51]|nr:hypothetical protein D7V96_01635 [bacterium D16-59]RKI62353.1 hypothetical protein D7V86_02210 [bacterium D16-51]